MRQQAGEQKPHVAFLCFPGNATIKPPKFLLGRATPVPQRSCNTSGSYSKDSFPRGCATMFAFRQATVPDGAQHWCISPASQRTAQSAGTLPPPRGAGAHQGQADRKLSSGHKAQHCDPHKLSRARRHIPAVKTCDASGECRSRGNEGAIVREWLLQGVRAC